MAKPLIGNRLKFPLSALWAMPAERRSALLLLGVLVNEANCLYKLLLKTAQVLAKRPTDDSNNPEVHANFSLTIFLTTTLVGKIYEGWDCICDDRLKATVDGLSLSDELEDLKTRLDTRLSGKLFTRHSDGSWEAERYPNLLHSHPWALALNHEMVGEVTFLNFMAASR
jgi:hypothetical protein